MSAELGRRARWFAAEFLVVVTGVLVALAVQAWYQGREELDRERAYLRQLASDLRETGRAMDQADSVARRGEHAGAMLVRAFNLPAVPADSVYIWLAGLGGVTYRLPVTGTAEALIASGDLSLIRDDSLRAAIPAYVTRTRGLTDLYAQAMDRWYRLRGELRHAAEPFDAAVLAGAARRPQDVRGNPLFDPHPDGATRVAFPLDSHALLRDRRAYATLAEMNTTRSLMSIVRNDMRADAGILAERVARVLGEPPERVAAP